MGGESLRVKRGRLHAIRGKCGMYSSPLVGVVTGRSTQMQKETQACSIVWDMLLIISVHHRVNSKHYEYAQAIRSENENGSKKSDSSYKIDIGGGEAPPLCPQNMYMW